MDMDEDNWADVDLDLLDAGIAAEEERQRQLRVQLGSKHPGCPTTTAQPSALWDTSHGTCRVMADFGPQNLMFLECVDNTAEEERPWQFWVQLGVVTGATRRQSRCLRERTLHVGVS
jgi:hypothetical protein